MVFAGDGFLATVCTINQGHYPCEDMHQYAPHVQYWKKASTCLGVAPAAEHFVGNFLQRAKPVKPPSQGAAPVQSQEAADFGAEDGSKSALSATVDHQVEMQAPVPSFAHLTALMAAKREGPVKLGAPRKAAMTVKAEPRAKAEPRSKRSKEHAATLKKTPRARPKGEGKGQQPKRALLPPKLI